MKIVFTGGGTAGHLTPIIAIVREIKKIRPSKDLGLFYVGPRDEYGLELLAKEGTKVKKILSGKMRRYFSIENFIDAFKIPIGILQAFFWLFILAPDFVFSKGGYGSFPAVFCARILHIPIFLHESDIAPGIASRIESKWAVEVFTSFENTEYFSKQKMICVGNPIRKEILGGTKKEAKKMFNLMVDKPLILILGGSQGSQKINDIILEILSELLKDFEIIHQTGKENFREVKAEVEVTIQEENLKSYYHPFSFLNEEELKNALGASDLIISRAGASAIFEIAAVEKPVILIPLPRSAQNHQLKNAYAFSGKEGIGVMEEENLKPHFFLERLRYLFSQLNLLKTMAINSKNFARVKAAKIIASYIIEYLK